ncbi:hypothetical protein PR048_013436 [Dryococelus australis]|uniref:Uncharacterized protein n=1 Tax=Dryococelus australis TaxID=614101 RepID=A0ABQ9HS65_9NEOP|nr:hypothetical protein PR048_013436 [Dryococelus australis]
MLVNTESSLMKHVSFRMVCTTATTATLRLKKPHVPLSYQEWFSVDHDGASVPLHNAHGMHNYQGHVAWPARSLDLSKSTLRDAIWHCTRLCGKNNSCLQCDPNQSLFAPLLFVGELFFAD